MAQQEHLDLIRQGVDVWNAWRKEHLDTKVDLSKANLRSIDLSSAYFTGVHFSGADLRETNLGFANFSGADLREADLREANLTRANFSNANLSNANLELSYLSRTDFLGAYLNGASFSNTTLINADFYGANLSRVNLSRAYLYGTNLSNAILSEANFSNTEVIFTIFGDVDLRVVHGLETILHKGPSTIGTDTLLRSEGDIPEIFLRGAGLSDSFIEYARSLTQRPIEYYTCFISYSSKDQDFVERLYADLQSNNVRCWYAPEDMKIGDKIRTRIDECIRMYDKLLLVLSQHSVTSSWVEAEVESALEKEQRHNNKSVLFPIMLDDSVMRTNQAWAADISRTRHIGDFTRWKEHDAYQRGLKKLLKDLKA